MKSEDWTHDPCLAPPFAVLDYGPSASIVDAEGREIVFERRAKRFVKELCAVINENSERLVNAWKADMSEKHKKGRRT